MSFPITLWSQPCQRKDKQWLTDAIHSHRRFPISMSSLVIKALTGKQCRNGGMFQHITSRDKCNNRSLLPTSARLTGRLIRGKRESVSSGRGWSCALIFRADAPILNIGVHIPHGWAAGCVWLDLKRIPHRKRKRKVHGCRSVPDFGCTSCHLRQMEWCRENRGNDRSGKCGWIRERVQVKC